MTKPNLETPVWKIVGGYTCCAKLKGRWHYVGKAAQQSSMVYVDLRARGLKPYRVQGMPLALSSIWAKHGATVQSLIDNLPPYPWLHDPFIMYRQHLMAKEAK